MSPVAATIISLEVKMVSVSLVSLLSVESGAVTVVTMVTRREVLVFVLTD